MSHQQSTIQVFNATGATLLTRLQAVATPELNSMTSTWLDGATAILQADFRYREAERCETFGVDPGRAADARSAADYYNVSAIETFDQLFPNAIEALKKKLPSRAMLDPESFARNLDTFSKVIRDQTADLEISVAQARIVLKIIEGVEQLAQTQGADGLCNRLIAESKSLARLREQRPQHNDPVSAAIAVIAAVSAMIVMFKCAAPPMTCTTPLNIALLVLFFSVAAGFGAASTTPLYAA